VVVQKNFAQLLAAVAEGAAGIAIMVRKLNSQPIHVTV
jgi:hypothetical protein